MIDLLLGISQVAGGEAAVFELKKYAGTQFDPEIVSLFVQIVQTKGKAASRTAPARSKDGGL